MDATSPQQACKPQHLHEPFSRTGGGQEQAEGPAWVPKLESTASPEDQVGKDSDAPFGWAKEAGRRQDTGMGEVGEDLTDKAGGTTESCFARQGQIRPWHSSTPAASVCLCKDPAPAATGGTGCAGLACQPGGPDARTAPDAGHIFSAARAAGCHTGLGVHLRDPEPPGY